MTDGEKGMEHSPPARSHLRNAIFISLAVLIIVAGSFRYVNLEKEKRFFREAEEEFRGFIEFSSVLSGGESAPTAINLSRALQYTPERPMRVEIRIKVYTGGEVRIEGGSSSGPFEFTRETRLLLYDSGEYIPAVLEFRARGGSP